MKTHFNLFYYYCYYYYYLYYYYYYLLFLFIIKLFFLILFLINCCFDLLSVPYNISQSPWCLLNTMVGFFSGQIYCWWPWNCQEVSLCDGVLECFQLLKNFVSLTFNFFNLLLSYPVYREFSNYHLITCIKNSIRLLRSSFL